MKCKPPRLAAIIFITFFFLNERVGGMPPTPLGPLLDLQCLYCIYQLSTEVKVRASMH